MFNLISLIEAVGYVGIFGIIFAESGILAGVFLPGDSLLFTAGFLASQNILNIWIIVIITFLGAVLGDSFGYFLGKKFGPAVFKRDNNLFLHKENLERAKNFYEKHGGKTIILARFVPIVRTFAPVMAGVGKMRYGLFISYNVIGGFVWSVGLTILGFYLGNVIPNIDRYILPVIFLIIILSVLPGIIHIVRNKEHRERLMKTIKRTERPDKNK